MTNYFQFIARETREIMAQLGVSQLVDLIGRTEFLTELDGISAKQNKLDLAPLLKPPRRIRAKRCTAPKAATRRSTRAC